MNDPLERWTPTARKVVDLALREALSLGHNYIGTEHILLALFRQEDTNGAHILSELGVDKDAVLDALHAVRCPFCKAPLPHEYRMAAQ